MFLVALTQLRQPLDQVVKGLTRDLLETEHEVRCRLEGTPPHLVTATSDRDAALKTLGLLRQGGNRAVACDSNAVRSSVLMVSLRTFELNDDGLVGHSPAGDPKLLPWSDVLAIVRADLDGSHMLYFFRASGDVPWMLREKGTSYAGLGDRKRDEVRASFLEFVQVVRGRVPKAAYDERLTHTRIDAAVRLLQTGSALTSASNVPDRRSSAAPNLSRGTPYPMRIPEAARVPSFPEGVMRRSTPPPARYDGPVTSLGAPWRKSEFPRSEVPPLAIGPTLIPRSDDDATARRVTIDVLAHLVALGHARGHL